jgi:pimeloyl-ACP methyl ester carboxylesterase
LPPGTPAAATQIRTYSGAGGRLMRFQVVEAKPVKHHLLYLHGIESHGGWFLRAALALREHGCTTFLLDRRGSGLNRDKEPGDAASAAVLIEDVRSAREAIGDPLLHLIGLSWGGKLATAVALEQPRNIASLLLVTPGLRVRVDLTSLEKLAVGLSLLTGGNRRFPVPIRPELFTRELQLLEFIRNDPLRVTSVTARFLFATLRLDRRIRRDLASLRAPVLLLLADQDEIVDNDGVLRLLALLPAGHLEVRRYESAMHSIQLEHTDTVVADIVGFLEA